MIRSFDKTNRSGHSALETSLFTYVVELPEIKNKEMTIFSTQKHRDLQKNVYARAPSSGKSGEYQPLHFRHIGQN